MSEEDVFHLSLEEKRAAGGKRLSMCKGFVARRSPTEQQVQGLRETREGWGQLFTWKTKGKAGASLRTMTGSHFQLKTILIVDK